MSAAFSETRAVSVTGQGFQADVKTVMQHVRKQPVLRLKAICQLV